METNADFINTKKQKNKERERSNVLTLNYYTNEIIIKVYLCHIWERGLGTGEGIPSKPLLILLSGTIPFERKVPQL